MASTSAKYVRFLTQFVVYSKDWLANSEWAAQVFDRKFIDIINWLMDIDESNIGIHEELPISIILFLVINS